MQNNSDSRQCRICLYLNEPKAENCAQCGAIIETKSPEFKSRPAPTRERFAVNAEPEKPSKKQSLKIWACLIIVAAALSVIGYQIYKPKEPVRAIRPQQQVIVQSDEDSEMPAKAPVKSKTAEEMGAKPLDIEKEKESISKEYREVGGDEGCSTEYTFNRFGQRVPVPPAPDKPLTIHGITVGVYYEKIENFALAEASFDIDRTCGENSRATFTVRRQYVWKNLGSGFFHWEYQPDGFEPRITDLIRRQRQTTNGQSEQVNQAENPNGGVYQSR